jgi:hypothetical protein
MATVAFWLLFLTFVGAFAAQVARRARLIFAAPNTFDADRIGLRAGRWLLDVLFQRQTILERPIPGIAHALVFWGFIAFAGYTTVEFLKGLGIVDLTAASWFSSCSSVARFSARSHSAPTCRPNRSSSVSSSRR